MYDFDVVGHRGAPREEPENTLASFERAIRIGVDWIEFDLRKTKDGVLVIIHDDKVDRTTNGRGFVRDMTFEELRELDAGNGQKIPSLQQVIDLSRDKVKMDMEIKEDGIEADVVSAIEKNDITARCMISSFMLPPLKNARELNSRIMTAAIMDKTPDKDCIAMIAHEIKADAIMLGIKIVSIPLLDELRRSGFKIGIWNADTRDQIEKYAAMEPDYLCSNYPERLIV
ncbi:MAG TPA: glycerophosphodiester phosphodiesterase family protein, partial [Methanocellaceae archaeon]